VFDPSSHFIETLLSELRNQLRENGKLVLIFSNLGELIGLHEKNFIENLCERYSLFVARKFQVPSNYQPQSVDDPIEKIRVDEQLQAFIITLRKEVFPNQSEFNGKTMLKSDIDTRDNDKKEESTRKNSIKKNKDQKENTTKKFERKTNQSQSSMEVIDSKTEKLRKPFSRAKMSGNEKKHKQKRNADTTTERHFQ